MLSNNISSGKSKNGLITSEKVRRSNHFVFIICILIAAFFWLLIKLSDQYNETYQFKVNYTNAPAEKRLTSVIDTNINITINAKGFEMLKLVLTEDLSTIDIDLNNFEIIHLNGNIYFINTNTIRERISEYIGIPQNQVEIFGQRLEFQMEDLFAKRISVVNKLNFKFMPQYNLYSQILITPSEVMVFGPENIIDTIQKIYTNNTAILDISSDIDENVELVNPNSNFLHLSLNMVNIKANVEKFTESSMEIPIDLSNINYKVKAFPNTVKIFFTIAQKDFSNVMQTQFKVKANLRNIDVLTANKLQLEIVAKPDFVSGIRLQPSEIEFLILK